MRLFYDEMASPVGPLLIIGNESTTVRIDYGTMPTLSESLHKWAKRYFKEAQFIQDPQKVEHVKTELTEYFNGTRKSFTFKFKLYGTDYQKQVWEALLSEIPYGETKTYKDIAISIQNPKSVRAVGGAVNRNPFSIVVPCHRVIGMNGKMVGYNGGLDKKELLLRLEQNLKTV